MTQRPADEDKTGDTIDAVITWVDGSSEKHSRKRQRYLAQAGRALHENAINPHRWACNDEILYCLQSLENSAPWVRKIWIVVDDETIKAGISTLMLQAKQYVEPAGAAAFAAVQSGAVEVKAGEKVLCICSGGNMDWDRMREFV